MYYLTITRKVEVHGHTLEHPEIVLSTISLDRGLELARLLGLRLVSGNEVRIIQENDMVADFS